MAHAAAKALDSALSALERDDGPAALDALLEAWRKWPSSRLADLIDLASKQTPSPPLEATKVKELEAEWLERAAPLESIDVRALLEAPWPVNPREAKARWKAWRKLPADPRVFRFGRELLKAGRYQSNAGVLLHRWWCEAALKANDPEASAYLHSVKRESAYLEFIYIAEPLLTKHPNLVPQPDETPELTAALGKLESKLGKSKGPKTGAGRAELFAGVYANPRDDGARLVLADWLMEQGDPRGEFIQLQVRDARGEAKDKDRKRATALARAAGATWLDGLEADVVWGSWATARFSRGFASQVTVEPHQLTTATHPGWATIEVMRLVALQGEPSFPSAELKSLREMHGVGLPGLALLAERTPHLEKVTLQMRVPFRVEASPRIDALSVSAPLDAAAMQWAAQAPFWPTLKHLELDGDQSKLEALWNFAQVLPRHLESLGVRRTYLSVGAWALRFSRDDQGAFSKLRAEFTGRTPGDKSPPISTALATLPADALTAFELIETKPVPEPELAELEKQLTRQVRLNR